MCLPRNGTCSSRRHLEQASRLAVGHVAEQLGLIRQLVILQMGVAGDGVVAHRLEQTFQGRGSFALCHQLATPVEVAVSQLAPLIDPVAGHITLDGIQEALVGTLALSHGDAGQGLLHLDRVRPCQAQVGRRSRRYQRDDMEPSMKVSSTLSSCSATGLELETSEVSSTFYPGKSFSVRLRSSFKSKAITHTVMQWLHLNHFSRPAASCTTKTGLHIGAL